MNHPGTHRTLAHRLVGVIAALALLGGALLTAGPASAAAADLAVGALTTNARTNPLGIGGDDPVFGWASTSNARNVVQSAYEIRVGTEAGEDDVWSSGKVASSTQVDVAYDGPALEPQTRYHWQVRVWDGDDHASDWSDSAWFETGILDASEWQGEWIQKSAGGEIDRWNDYTADVDFDIQDLALGVFLRARNTQNAYMWQISTADGTAVPKFRPHTRVNGVYTLLDNKAIDGITSAQLLNGTHRLSITVDGATITTKLDGTQIDQRTDASFAKGFIGFRQDFAGNTNETADVKAVKVTAKNGDVLLDTDFSGNNPFDGGTVTDAGLRVGDRTDVLLHTSDSNLPLLRTEFSTEPGKTIASARAYASAHGVYELQLNGEEVGDQHLAPGWTRYEDRIQYQTYDVTDQVEQGRNAFGAELGKGWWAGKVGMWGPGMYGTDLALIAQLRIDYTDGTHQIVATDDSWKSHAGPFVQADNIDGETYDANAEQPGWDHANYDDAQWGAVVIGASDTAKLVPQIDEPVRTTEEIAANKRTDSPDVAGASIYDLGQNMVGVARMRLHGVAGQTVRIRYGEELRQSGALYVGNLRAAKVTDYYTFKTTGTVVYTPKFTQHGFRYIEISGTTTAPTLEDVTGVVWGSDLAATGSLTTSDTMLNQLQSNISWGQRGNFLSIPTDTPARDERLGWTGDINVFAPTASYLRDTRSFLQKWTVDLRDSAYANGNLPGIAPSVPTIDLGAGLGWSDAGITVPYAAWHAQGDTAIVRQNYAAMQKFFGFVKQGAGADLIDSARGNWNDWLNLDDNTGTAVLGTAYYAEDARMLSEMAAAIGEDDDAAEYAALSQSIREAFTADLVAADGTVEGNSQTAYAMALGMDLVTDPALRTKVGEKFLAKLKTSDYHLTTGFLGTPWLLPALSSIDRDDVAYTMILKKDYPSWGYEIEHGATTMWERWNSINPDGSFGDEGMNSFNHYAYGAVGDWMYKKIGGIEALQAGYKKSRIAPAVGGGLTEGHGAFTSVYGEISSHWKTEGDDFALDVRIPVNTTAEVSVPATNLLSVSEGGVPLADVDGVSDISFEDGVATFTVGSGTYSFRADADRALYGELAEAIQKVDDHAGDLNAAGDLADDARTHVGDSLGSAKGEVEAALEADLGGDDEQVAQHLSDGLAHVTALRDWVAESSIDGPVKKDLDTRLEQLERLFGKSVASALGVSVVIAPVAESAGPGESVAGTVEVTNAGTSDLSDLKASIAVDGWDVKPVEATRDALAAGDATQLPFAVTVPKHQKPGTYDAAAELTFTNEFGTFTLADSTAWVSVDSGVTIGDVTSQSPVEGSEERATVTVKVENAGDSAVSGQAVVEGLPTGWSSVPSERVTVAAGESADVVVPVNVGLEGTFGAQPVTVRFLDEGVGLAEKSVALPFALAAPGGQDLEGQLDHVDFGNATSESAHAVQASASSGTSPSEAGLTRRYSHTNYPGSWFSAEYDVTPGEPFLIRNLETFDGAKTKKYEVWVDDTLVTTTEVKRTETGQGTKVYQLLVDDPEALDNDGTVRIKYQFLTQPNGAFDPSIADSWVLPIADDDVVPLASASVTGTGPHGDNGWYRGDAAVAVTAADNRPGAVTVETGQDAGWQSYVAPVVVSGDGKHALSYRAKDAAGNSTGEKKVAVWIDATAPGTQLSVTRGSGVDNADRATLRFAAQDALSGVAATTYRIDGGDWRQVGAGDAPLVTGFGEHTVEFFSTDVAGNPEALRTMVVDLADVDGIAAIVAPQVKGTATYGATLTATTGTWNTKGLAFGYQWLRDGKAIVGRTATTYKPTSTDVGHRISVRVTASKSGLASASSTSAATAKVAKATTKTSVKSSKSKVKAGQKVKVSIAASSSVGTPRGTVRIYENGKKVTTVSLSSSGKASYTLKLKKKGLRTIKVVYSGNSTLGGSTATTKVRVR